MPRKKLVELSETLISWASRRKKRRKRKKSKPFISNDKRNKSLYFFIAIFSFFLFVFLTFPSEKVTRGFLYTLKKQTKLLWRAEKISLSLLFGPKIIAKNIEVAPGANYRKRHWGALSPMIERGLYVNRIEFKPSILKLIPLPFGLKKSISAGDFEIHIWDATFFGYFAAGKKTLDIDMKVEDFSLRNLAPLYDTTGLDGKIEEAYFSFYAPNARIEQGSGEIKIRAEKMQLQVQRFASLLPTLKELGILKLGKLNIDTNIRNGNVLLKTFYLRDKKSGFDLKVEGDVQLKSRIQNSKLEANILLNPGKRLLPTMKDPILQAFLPFTSDISGSNYRLRLQGSLGSPKPKKK